MQNRAGGKSKTQRGSCKDGELVRLEWGMQRGFLPAFARLGAGGCVRLRSVEAERGSVGRAGRAGPGSVQPALEASDDRGEVGVKVPRPLQRLD